jgi:hypothetical protein
MAQGLFDGLDSLTSVLPSLSSAIAEATAVVEAVDQFLAEELAVGPWVASRPFDTQRALGDDGREFLLTSHLACGRLAGKYRVHVLTVTLDRVEGKDPFNQIVGEERTAWQTCSREVRLQSFALLPELLGLLGTKILEITLETSRTAETVREVLKSMGGFRQPTQIEAPDQDGEDEKVLDAAGFVVSAVGSDLFKRPKVR